MTLPNATAWYPLGGHNPTTAHSSSQRDYAEEQRLLQRAGPRGIEPESSAAWDRMNQQYEVETSAMRAALMRQQAAQEQNIVVCSTAASQGFVQFGVASGLSSFHPSSYVDPNPPPIVQAKSTDATIRSMELLYDWLSPEQRKQLAVRNYFDVVGGYTGIRYRIYPPSNYNVHQLVKDSSETECKLCFQPKDTTLPKGDIWLAQKLALELDELATLEIANRSATYTAYTYDG